MRNIALFFVLTITIPVFSQEQSPPRKIGALLLNTGFVVDGEATLRGELYHVQSKLGSSRLPKKLVEYEAADVKDAYRYKRGKTDLGDYEAVLQLGNWCKRTGLKEETIIEYERALSIAPNQESTNVVLSLIRMEKSPPKQIQEKKIEENDDFDYIEWSRTIPFSTVESFNKHVQPVLLRRCGNSDCHGHESKQQMRLNPVPSGKALAIETLKNLKSAMEYIDMEQPESSPLLSVSTKAHGGLPPMLNEQSQSHFVLLHQWTVKSAQTLPVPLPKKVSGEIQQASALIPMPKEAARQSNDPFDPNVFNTKFHKGTSNWGLGSRPF